MLRTAPTREEAERGRPPLEQAAGVVDVVPVAAGGFALRLRECSRVQHKIALIREIRAASGFGLAESVHAFEGVNALPRTITELSTMSSAEATREVVGRALIPWALDPARR